MKVKFQQLLGKLARAVGALLRDIGYEVMISLIVAFLLYKYPMLDYMQAAFAVV